MDLSSFLPDRLESLSKELRRTDVLISTLRESRLDTNKKGPRTGDPIARHRSLVRTNPLVSSSPGGSTRGRSDSNRRSLSVRDQGFYGSTPGRVEHVLSTCEVDDSTLYGRRPKVRDSTVRSSHTVWERTVFKWASLISGIKDVSLSLESCVT